MLLECIYLKEPNKQALRPSNIKELFNKSNLDCIHSREVKVLDCKTLVPSNFHFKHLNPIPPTRLFPPGKLVLSAPKIKNVREEGTLALFWRGMNYGAPPSPPNIPGRPPLLRVPALAWATRAFCREAEWPAPGWESLSGVGAGWGWGGQPRAPRAALGPEVAVTRGAAGGPRTPATPSRRAHAHPGSSKPARRPESRRQQRGPATGPRGRAGAGGGGSAVAMATRGVRPSPCSPSAAFAASPPARLGRRLLLRGPGSAGRQQHPFRSRGVPGPPGGCRGGGGRGAAPVPAGRGGLRVAGRLRPRSQDTRPGPTPTCSEREGGGSLPDPARHSLHPPRPPPPPPHTAQPPGGGQ